MTREERNTKLKHFITCLKCEVSGRECDDNCPVQYKAGNMGEIIENLEAISKALEQEPCDVSDTDVGKIDAVSRQAAIDVLRTMYDTHIVETEGGDEYIDYNDTVYEIKDLPSVNPQPQPKTGHWIRMKAYEKWGCSECNTVFRFTFKEHDYCPNCGAKMVEPQESEDADADSN